MRRLQPLLGCQLHSPPARAEVGADRLLPEATTSICFLSCECGSVHVFFYESSPPALLAAPTLTFFF